jgi:GTPase SAR1 family protein
LIQSPFKFLDTYERTDKYRYFGRERETAQLYNAVFASNLTLLYGASGVGKSSLIQCGLANKFYDTDWQPIFIRRAENINVALDRQLSETMSDLAPDRFWGSAPIDTKLKTLFELCYRPIYLIFDQFEELFISGNEQEQQLFYNNIRVALQQTNIQVKVIISIREEWIASLNQFEKTLPNLFDNRLRVERMHETDLARVIEGSIAKAQGVSIVLEDSQATIDAILTNIRDREGVDLTNLQIYLNDLFVTDRDVVQKNPESRLFTFNTALVKRVGKMGNVLSHFIDEQLSIIDKKLAATGVPNAAGIPLEVLFALVTDNGTKLRGSVEEIETALPKKRKITQAQIQFCLDEFINIKLLRQA